LAALKRYPWPGNVRELRNVIESLVIFAKGQEITLEDLPGEYRLATAAPPTTSTVSWQPSSMAEIEREAILRTLDYTDGHRARAAKMLEIGLRTLQRKLKDYGEIAPRDDDEEEVDS
jgi:two-component system response regulator HydG